MCARLTKEAAGRMDCVSCPSALCPSVTLCSLRRSRWRPAKARRALWQDGLNLTAFISGRPDRSAEDHAPVVAPRFGSKLGRQGGEGVRISIVALGTALVLYGLETFGGA